MKTEHKVFLLCVLAGLSVWVADAAADAIWFYRGQSSFFKLLISGVPAHEMYIRIVTLSVSVILGLTASVYAGRRRRAAEALAESEASLSATLSSIGDGVIAVDTRASVTFINEVARELTGWGAEARGRPMAEVFHIVNAQTRRPAENPVERVLREGAVHGLANHTLLIARDGKERQIADSAAPIRTPDGRISGVVLVFRDVTEAYEKDKQLRDSERRYRTLFGALGEGFALHEILCDETGKPCDYRFLDVNPAFERITGLHRAKVIGRTMRNVLPDTEQSWIDTYGKVALTGQSVSFDNYMAELDKHFEVIAFSPAERQFATLFVDVTDHKKAEARVAKLNVVLRAIRNVNQLITQETDRDALLQGACRHLVATQGYSSAWVAARDESGRLLAVAEAGLGGAFEAVRERLVRGDWPACTRGAEQEKALIVIDSGTERCSECHMHTGDEKAARLCIELAHAGRSWGVLCVSALPEVAHDPEQQDLFEEVAGDIALALHNIELEARHRRAEEHIEVLARFPSENPSPVLRIAADGTLLYANAASRPLLNDWQCEVGRTVPRIWREQVADVLGSRAGQTLEIEYDGRVLSIMVVPVIEAGYANLYGRDVTHRQQAERALRRERDRAQKYLDVVRVIIVALDSVGNVTLINAMGCEVLGLTEEEILGVNWFDNFIPERVGGDVKSTFDSLMAGKVAPVEYYENAVLCSDGAERIIAWHNVLLEDEAGGIIGTLSAGDDVTERRWEQDQLRHAQKMEAIGRLAGAIAHDFNNQLTVINGYCGMVLAELPAAHAHRSALTEIHNAADRAGRLTGQLLAYSRKQMLQPEAMDLRRVLAEMRGSMKQMIGEDIDLSVNLAPDLVGPILADPAQFQQALMNLLANARDAMPEGGEVTIAAANVDLDEEGSRQDLNVPPGRYVLLTVTDTGVGMDAGTQERIFEPFYTTKPTGRGTGFGLAMVYGFVKQSRGHIDVHSRLGKGATFRIFLPRVGKAELPAESPEPAGAVTGGSETILVAEDEPAIRNLLLGSLRDLGYDVLAADQGNRIQRLAEAHAGRIDLLVTDVVMPEVSGPELAERVNRAHPETKVLFVSGYAPDVVVQHGAVKPGVNLLNKPFTPKGLAEAVRGVLDARPDSPEA